MKVGARLPVVLAVAAALIITGAALAAYLVWNDLAKGPGPNAAFTPTFIEAGSSVQEIARQLEDEGLIRDARSFELVARVTGKARELKAGEFGIPARASARRIVDILASGEVLRHDLTIPEGLTSQQVVDLLKENERLTGTIETVPEEGALLPETYRYARGDTRSGMLARMRRAMDRTLAEAWEDRAADLPFETPEEALILASIIEKETHVDGERPKVAGVFINRLRIGMRLQADPTVIYGITLGEGPLGRRLLRDDLRTESPYNTYLNTGLPPGPIANPGAAAIRAALNPAEHEYIYFVADGSGGHAFARTLAEHNRNVAAWRRARRSR